MCPDDERLLYVGGFGRAGNEGAEAGLVKSQALVGFVHVVDDLLSIEGEDEMLGEEEEGLLGDDAVRDPNGAVLGDPEPSRTHGEIDTLVVVRARLAGGAAGRLRNQLDDPARLNRHGDGFDCGFQRMSLDFDACPTGGGE
jgi:hypothetical protein